MSFLNPLYLAGAALIALPIVLHLLRRDVAPPVPFTAVRLLRRTTIERSRRHRLRDLLLLAARVCALLLLAASFARPYARAVSAGVGTTVIAVDRSFSMASPARIEQARALAREAIDQAGGNRVALVAFDDRADVLAAPGSAAEARAALASIVPAFGATRYAAAFDKAAELLMDEVPARLVMITDLQRNGFDQTGAVLPAGIELVVRDAGAAKSNISIADVGIEGRRVTATIRNDGTATRTVAVSGVADDRSLPIQRVPIAADAASDVRFETAADVQRVAVTIADDPSDDYAGDNQRFAVADRRTLPGVLIVAGAPGSASGFYLSQALQAEGDGGPEFNVRTVSAATFTAMPAAQLQDTSVVAIVSTHGLDRRAGEVLRGFVQTGGGVFIAAAPDVDASVLSTLFGWQPALAASDVRGVGVLAATDLRHPMLRPFNAVAANFGQVVFDRAWRIEPGASWRVLARYTAGDPALAERQSVDSAQGRRGRVLLFTSDLDRRWNDFPLHPAFVPFAQEAVRYLGAQVPAVSSYLVSDVPSGIARRPGIVQVSNHPVAVNVDARESAIDRVTPAEFVKLVSRSSVATEPRSQRLAQDAESHQNYWRYGLLLMLATLVIEAFVASSS
jgi:hypothetical protein